VQSYSPYSSQSIDVKTSSPDLADFAMTRPLIHLAQCLGDRWHRAVTAGSGCIKIRQNLPVVTYQAKSLGKSRCDDRDMPMNAPTIVRIATVGKVEVES
jgi:hypothetical protein